MEISVVIPTYNNREVLQRTIQALLEQTFPHEYEIVVADDGSTDGTAEMVEAIRGAVPVRFVRQANLGRSAVRNLGARAARGRILVFIDSDVWATPTLLAEHHKHYAGTDRRIGVMGVCLTHPDTLVTPYMKARQVSADLTRRRHDDLHPLHVTTRNVSVLRADLDAVGGFDERFGGYGWEDMDAAMRLHAQGVRFEYEPEALGYHYHVETLDTFRGKMRQAGKGAVYFWQKYGRSAKLGIFFEIAPPFMPLKWLVYHTPLVTPLIRWLLPRAEAREWVLVLAECYNHLIWRSYYDGVFEALRQTRAGVRAAARHRSEERLSSG